MSARGRYIIGIDLGTTNSAVACAERRKAAGGRVVPQPILQRVSETQVAERRTLPSFLYLPGEHELPEGALALPWQADAEALVGDFARAQGARIPTRLVSSAKSWLCHPRADQTAPILPWDAPPGVSRVSPVEASARYLLHLREAWNHTHDASDRFQDQEIVLAVPASFNEVARELTVQAARLAGLENVTLLEEPQAAFYAWLERQGDDPTRSLRGHRGILVCDIGGGTTDFTLIKVEPGSNDLPSLRRVAVGEHLMLGGDNMDLAIAHVIEQALDTRFDARAWGVLTHACREAKERLLADQAPEEWTVVIPGSGSRLLGGMTRAPLERDEVHQIVLEGFFPEVAYHASPEQHSKALAGWGLPYASDAAVTRHLAAFLRHQGEIADPRDLPDLVLFNGAALEPALLRDRIRKVMGQWSGQAPSELENRELDLAVARGAAYYGWARENGGLRIGGGTARAYYVGISGPEPQAACLIPKGLEEGQSVEILEPAFHVVVDRPVAFPLFASSTRGHDLAGTMVALGGDDFEPLPPLTTVLGTRKRGSRLGATPSEASSPSPALEMLESTTDVERALDDEDAPPPPTIPVHLKARVTEIGTLELWCIGPTPGQRWRLQFQVRGGETPGRGGVVPPGFTTVPTEDPRAVQRAQQLVVSTYRTRAGQLEAREVKPRTLPSAIEDLLRERRDDWSLGALRALWEALDRVQGRRRSTPEFEAPWLNLTGFTLRPGFGYPLDDWRINRTFDIFEGGLQHPKHGPARIEWWVLWRRLAGGLDRLRQQQVFYEIAPHLLSGRKHLKTRLGPPASHAELMEMLRLAASLERLDPEQKEALGEKAMARLQSRPGALDAWMLARLGARSPLAASPHHCVPPELAARWIDQLLALPFKDRDLRSLAIAVCQMGRVCDDRARDLTPSQREAAARLLEQRGQPELARPLRELVVAAGELQAVLVGESIPLGLLLQPQ